MEKAIGAFVLGVAACFLVVGYIAGEMTESIARDCEIIGKFRYKEKSFSCVPSD